MHMIFMGTVCTCHLIVLFGGPIEDGREAV